MNEQIMAMWIQAGLSATTMIEQFGLVHQIIYHRYLYVPQSFIELNDNKSYIRHMYTEIFDYIRKICVTYIKYIF